MNSLQSPRRFQVQDLRPLTALARQTIIYVPIPGSPPTTNGPRRRALDQPTTTRSLARLGQRLIDPQSRSTLLFAHTRQAPLAGSESHQGRLFAEPKSRLELEPHHRLRDARIAGAVDGAESVDVVDCAIRFQVQVGRDRISQRSAGHGRTDAAKLDVVERIESIGLRL
jgi:hypothetical protein